MVVGFDGLPGCGKSTLVYLIGEYLKAMGRPNLVLGLDISLKDIECAFLFLLFYECSLKCVSDFIEFHESCLCFVFIAE